MALIYAKRRANEACPAPGKGQGASDASPWCRTDYADANRPAGFAAGAERGA